MIELKELLNIIIEKKASDLHLAVGIEPIIRVEGNLIKIQSNKLDENHLKKYAVDILGDKYNEYEKIGEIDMAYSICNIGRFRVNIFKERGFDAISLRAISLKVPELTDFDYPYIFKELCNKRRGLILVTGATGSGKSTTLAAMINEINKNMSSHIITLEEPIEFIHNHNKSIINQREIGRDSKCYKNALKATLREDPDVILIGELRDYETIAIAITAAETGHLVFATLHTLGADKTIDRIIDVFPSYQQQQIRVQLSTILEAVISQQLVPTVEGNRTLALEIMLSNPAIQNLIREGKSYQIQSIIQTGKKYGMKTMDKSLIDLYKSNIISEEVALNYSIDRENVYRSIY